MSTSISRCIKLNSEECIAGAGEFFENAAHIENESMRRDADAALSIVRERIGPRISYVIFDDFELEGTQLSIINECGKKCHITCKAFERISPGTVKKVCAFALTAGETHVDADRITVQLFGDYWGTALVEAIKLKLIDILKKDEDCVAVSGVSEFFGPGLYGMPIDEMQKLKDICGFDEAGVSISESCYLLPEKSVAGIVFITTDGYEPMEGKCEHCIGNVSSCSLCK